MPCNKINEHLFNNKLNLCWPPLDNGLTSTPRWNQTNGCNVPPSKYDKLNEIIEEEAEENGSLSNFKISSFKYQDENGSRSTSLESGRHVTGNSKSINDENQNLTSNHIQLLLSENKRLSNDVSQLEERLASVTVSYEGLKFKHRETEKENEEENHLISELEGKIQALELQLEVENESKNELSRKLFVSESTIENLHYQLQEISKDDCLARARHTHETMMDSLKKGHESKVMLLEGEVEGLKHELCSKRKENENLKSQLERLKEEQNKQEMSKEETNLQQNSNLSIAQIKEMMEAAKQVLKKELEDQTQKEMQKTLATAQSQWTKQANQKFQEAKKEWIRLLQNEVDEVVRRVRFKVKLDEQSQDSSLFAFHLRPVEQLWKAVEESCEEKERKINGKVEELRIARQDLEQALIESKANDGNNASSSFERNELLEKLKDELEIVKNEAELLKHKLYKYKQHYRQLTKKHNFEIERLQQEFSTILKEKFSKNFNGLKL